jgi:hypothetical protein
VAVDPRLLPAARLAVVDREAQPLEVERRPAVEVLDDDAAPEIEVDGVRAQVAAGAVGPGAVLVAEPEVELARSVELLRDRLGVGDAHVS